MPASTRSASFTPPSPVCSTSWPSSTPPTARPTRGGADDAVAVGAGRPPRVRAVPTTPACLGLLVPAPDPPLHRHLDRLQGHQVPRNETSPPRGHCHLHDDPIRNGNRRRRPLRAHARAGTEIIERRRMKDEGTIGAVDAAAVCFILLPSAFCLHLFSSALYAPAHQSPSPCKPPGKPPHPPPSTRPTGSPT